MNFIHCLPSSAPVLKYTIGNNCQFEEGDGIVVGKLSVYADRISVLVQNPSNFISALCPIVKELPLIP